MNAISKLHFSLELDEKSRLQTPDGQLELDDAQQGIAIFKRMLQHKKDTLRKRGYPERQALVTNREWRDEVERWLGMGKWQSKELECDLISSGGLKYGDMHKNSLLLGDSLQVDG